MRFVAADPVGGRQYVVGDGRARGHASLDLDNRDFGHVKKYLINVNFDTSRTECEIATI